MRSFIIATMLTFALVACEDTTSTTTETTENEKGIPEEEKSRKANVVGRRILTKVYQ